jgi:hypothetical protein
MSNSSYPQPPQQTQTFQQPQPQPPRSKPKPSVWVYVGLMAAFITLIVYFILTIEAAGEAADDKVAGDALSAADVATKVANDAALKAAALEAERALNCGPKMHSTDFGFADPYRGWYDAYNCGEKNNYCRWVGDNGTGGDPQQKTTHGSSRWSCTRPNTDFAPTIPKWDLTVLDRA